MLGVGQSIFDIFYPIGTYYETSDTNFNPNTAHSWYGTWVEDTAGRVLVSLDTTQAEFDTVGEVGGSKYLQKHDHVIGFMLEGVAHSGEGNNLYGKQNTGKNWGTPTGDSGTGNSGNLQPYIVIKRWHRTA